MKTTSTLLMLFLAFNLNAQVNAYAAVTSISSTALGVSNSNESFGTFTAGDQVIIMQMQDNVIGVTTNTVNFGNLGTIASAGIYEVAIISSVVRTLGIVTLVNINSPLAKTFNLGTRSSVQLISFPQLGTTGYSTVSDISAVPWNGYVGGVVAFRVAGTLTLNHNITADNSGFRGGAINGGTAGSCDDVTYRIAVNDLNGTKGEGIFKPTNSAHFAGRAKILNGGGGGNSHNGGGGGGSNMSAGGEGGKGYSCTTSAGGLGGISLNSFVSADRVFMGGGGGSGEANNGFNTAGGNGGGIIIIKASQIITTGSGTGLRISANGQTAADVGNDGAGAGGAGGSVLLNVASWSIAAAKQLTISSNGGSGGSVSDPSAHGGGAGAGQGAVIFSTSIPTTNITTTTLNGLGGRNYTGGTYADNGVGSNNIGIYTSSFSILRLSQFFLKGTRTENAIGLEWSTINDENINRYEIQRSTDGITFQNIGNISSIKNVRLYTYNDANAPEGIAYYRLIIYDKNGKSEISEVVVIKFNKVPEISVSLIPNPVRENASLLITSKLMATGCLRIVNSYGITVATKSFYLSKGDNNIQLYNVMQLVTGTYHVFVTVNNNSTVVKMLVQK